MQSRNVTGSNEISGMMERGRAASHSIYLPQRSAASLCPCLYLLLPGLPPSSSSSSSAGSPPSFSFIHSASTTTTSTTATTSYSCCCCCLMVVIVSLLLLPREVNEDLLQGGLRQVVLPDAPRRLQTLQRAEGRRQVHAVPESEPEGRAVLLLQLAAAQGGSQLMQARRALLLPAADVHFVAGAELVLEVLARAQTLQPPGHHDADTGAYGLALLAWGEEEHQGANIEFSCTCMWIIKKQVEPPLCAKTRQKRRGHDRRGEDMRGEGRDGRADPPPWSAW